MRQKGEDPQFKREMSDCLEVVESLSQKEKNKILSVLKKDESLRKGQEKKISVLKREIQEIRMKGVLRPGDNQDKMCRRCRAEFGFIFNRGTLCPVCRFKVCRNCQEFMFNGSWICIFCYKQRQLKWMTGEWASFEQNPLRKWASGSDLLRASFQLKPGPSIDIDEPQQNGSGSRGRKNARNGVPGGDPNRSRVEAPRDGDQHKLSQLFDVLRSKKPDQSSQETEVRRITSRRYHESDSDSSSSSDLETRSGHSSPNALSVTESEKDAQVSDVNRDNESPRLSEGASSPRYESSRNISLSKQKREQPIPSPRSPKPAPRRPHSDIADSEKIVVDPDKVVRPKVRQERNKSDMNLSENKTRLSVDETSQVSMSKSFDTNLGNNSTHNINNDRRAVSNAELNLQKHVNRTKESLERKKEEFKSESRNSSLSESHVKKVRDKKHRKSADDLLVSNNKSLTDGSRKRDSGYDLDGQAGEVVEETIVAVRKSKDNESAILMQDSPTLDRRKPKDIKTKSDTDFDIPDSSKEYVQEHVEEINIQIPRGGSPYSISMDSLPSSHPSPTFYRGSSIGGSSHADSSDTDSISRMSHPEIGEHSGTESAQHGHDDDFVVEEISKIRFQRVSKKVGQMGVVSKLTKSPRNVSTAVGAEIGERETQEAFTNVRSNEEVETSQPLADINRFEKTNEMDYDPYVRLISKQVKNYNDNELDNSVEDIFVKGNKTEELSWYNDDPYDRLISKQVKNYNDNELDNSVEDIFVKGNKTEELSWYNDDPYDRLISKQVKNYNDNELDNSVEDIFVKENKTEELSWYNDDPQAEWYKKHLKPNPRHSSVRSNLERMPSEADSLEGMIDDMVEEGQLRNIYARQTSCVESEGSFCVTPVSPLPPEMYERNKTGTYRLAYISDDNVLDGESGDNDDGGHHEDYLNGNKGLKEQKMQSMGSLDLLLYNQGLMGTAEDLALDYEVQEALKTRSTKSGKSNSSSLDSLQDVVDRELSMEQMKDDVDKEFTSTVASIQHLSAMYETDTKEGTDEQKVEENRIESTREELNYDIADCSEEVKKTKLQAKSSLDALIESQQDFIENPNENIELEQHFDFLHEGKANNQEKDYIDGNLKQDEAGSDLQKLENIKLDNTNDDRSPRGKLQPTGSLDVLINNQGDLINASEQEVELSAEFIAALEQEFNEKRRVSNDELDIHSDFSYLGIQQNTENVVNKNSLYHYSAEKEVKGPDSNDGFEKVFGGNEITEPSKLAIKTIKSMPIGYLGQKSSEDSSDSDALSVIEEEDETEMHLPDLRNGEKNNHIAESEVNENSDLDILKGQVIMKREIFEKKLIGTKTVKMAEEKTHLKGKIYTKARDMENKVKGLSCGQSDSEKSWKQVSSKLHDKFKRLHDHWVAIEHYEADILDLEDENETDDGYTEREILTNASQITDSIEEPESKEEHGGRKQDHDQIKTTFSENEIESLNDLTSILQTNKLEKSDLEIIPGHSGNQEQIINIEYQQIGIQEIIELQNPGDYKPSEDSESSTDKDKHNDVHIDLINDVDGDKSLVGSDVKNNGILNYLENTGIQLQETRSTFDLTDINSTSDKSKLEEKIDYCKGESKETIDSNFIENKEEILEFEQGLSIKEESEIGMNLPQCNDTELNIKELDVLQANNKDCYTNLDVNIGSSSGQNVSSIHFDMSVNSTVKENSSTTTENIPHLKAEKTNKTHDNETTANENENDSASKMDDKHNCEPSENEQEISVSDNDINDFYCKERNLNFTTFDPTEKQTSTDIQKEVVTVCRSISEGDSELTYRVSEGSETCHSIDETTIIELEKEAGSFVVIESDTNKSVLINDINDSDKIVRDSKGKGVFIAEDDSINNNPQDTDDVFKENNNDYGKSDIIRSEMKHNPLKRLCEENQNVEVKIKVESQMPNQLYSTKFEVENPNVNDTSEAVSPHSNDSNIFKVPGAPHSVVRVRPSSPSIPSSPALSTSSSIEERGTSQPEKLAGFHESPLTISECSVSQDDSGNISGGSRGATPEHRRTDSGYSQSSLPSTLSTVTDRSEDEEDIDKVIANIHTKAGSRGNLLSVFSDSRESIASYYSDAGDIAYSTVPVTGEILFSINYNYKTVMLEIGVKQCKDIAVADTKRNRSDPYVKTYLLPDRTRSGKRKTKIKKHTVNPTFDETLKYSISKSELENRTLWVTLWHSDRFGRNIFLGEVTINFDYFKFNDPSPKWYQLQERMDSQPSSMMVYKGDLSVCIRYVPADKVTTPTHTKGKHKKESASSRGQLEVKVKEARNLTAVRSNGFSDPFCKGYLLPERHKISKQKTSVIKKDCNPVWDHTFVFEDVSLAELRERCLELTIWDYEKLSSNDFLGGVRLNLGTGMSQGKQVDWMDARGEEMSIWQAMLDRPHVWIDGALILRPNMEKRKF